jgi:integrase
MMGKVKKSRQRDRRPTAKELKDLCAYFDKKSTLPMRDLIWFSIHTAMRASEVTRLRWEDFHPKDKTILIRDRKDPKEKAGNNQTVPLLAEAIEIIKRQPKDESGLIFPYREATFSTIFPRACTALGIEDLRWHDLRHEGASRLFERGYQIHEVALFTGHKDWAMLKRYTQLRAKDLRRL